MLFIENSANGESAWVPTGNNLAPCQGPASADVDIESRKDFLDSLDTTTMSDSPNNVDELK